MIAIQKIKKKRDEQTYQWWFPNYCSESTFLSPWICLLGFPSLFLSLIPSYITSDISEKWQQALFILFLKIRTRWASSSSPWRVDLSSPESYCHVISEFWTAFTRPGALLLALASCCSLWRVYQISNLMLSASTRPALALISPWRVNLQFFFKFLHKCWDLGRLNWNKWLKQICTFKWGKTKEYFTK